MTCPAEGVPFPNVWSFAKGIRPRESLLDGDDTAIAVRTSNGWADESTFWHWAEMVVRIKKERNLEKLLIFVDNAAIHTNIDVAALFVENKIELFGLIPSATGYQQPLDVCFFGGFKPKVEAIATQNSTLRTYASMAGLSKLAIDEMVATATANGTSVLAQGFKMTGIYPFNPNVFSERQFQASDVATGLSPGDEAIKAAVLRGDAAGKILLEEIISRIDSSTAKVLNNMAQKQRETNQLIWNETRKEAYNPEKFKIGVCYTDPEFHARNLARTEKELDDARAVKARKEERATKAAVKAVEMAEKKKMTAIKKEERQKELQKKENDKALKAALKLAKHNAALNLAPSPGAAKPAAVARKRKIEVEPTEYGAPYKQRKR